MRPNVLRRKAPKEFRILETITAGCDPADGAVGSSLLAPFGGAGPLGEIRRGLAVTVFLGTVPEGRGWVGLAPNLVAVRRVSSPKARFSKP